MRFCSYQASSSWKFVLLCCLMITSSLWLAVKPAWAGSPPVAGDLIFNEYASDNDANGNDFVELLVLTDNLDLRGLRLSDNELVAGALNQNESVLVFGNDVYLDNLPRGALIVVWTVVTGITPDTTVNPAAGDWTLVLVPGAGVTASDDGLGGFTNTGLATGGEALYAYLTGPDGASAGNDNIYLDFLSYESDGGDAPAGLADVNLASVADNAYFVGNSAADADNGANWVRFDGIPNALSTPGQPNPGQDLSGLRIVPDAAPSVGSTAPANADVDVAVNANLDITFSEAVNTSGNWFQIVCTTSGTRNVADTVVSGGPTTFTIDPLVDFANSETCGVTIVAAAITDQDANDPPDAMSVNYSFGFTVVGVVDTAPSIANNTPANGAVDVATNATITINFSEAVNLTANAVTLECPAGAPIALTGLPASNVTGVTLTPATALPNATTCTATVLAAQVSDVDANDPPDTPATDYTFGFTTVAPLCGAPFTPIYQIQGTGNAAAVTGVVTTQGVVVGDYEYPGSGSTGSFLRGFFLQDLTGDATVESSDGIFVFNGNNNSVNLGQVVRVTGAAGEFQDQTQLSGSLTIVDCGTTATPLPVDLTLPVPAAVNGVPYLERLEGMLVRLPQTLYVTEHFQLGRFGQVVMSSGDVLFQPTNLLPPGLAGSPRDVLQQANNLNRIIIDDEFQNQNPDPIQFARGGNPLSASNTLRGGDTATGIVGVLNYTWAGNSASPNAYRIRPLNALGGAIPNFQEANTRPTSPRDVGGRVKVTAGNLLNYFNTFADNNAATPGCYPSGADTDCRGAESQLEFDRQTPKTVTALIGSGADIIGFMEMENDGYSPDSAIQDLVNRLNAVAGAGVYAFIDADARTGQTNVMGTDAIRVGLIYKPAVVTPVGATAVLNTGAFGQFAISTPPGSIQRNRPPLAQAFEENATGARLVVVVNHLKSKGSACTDNISPVPSDPDLNDGQGNCNLTRLTAANELVAWLASDPTGTGDPDVLIMGDLNAYAQEEPVTAIKNAGYTNLIETFIGQDAYSFVFDGQWGYLDHALATASLSSQVNDVTEWHINADEPNVLDYNTNFKSAGQVISLYAPDQFRASDHDPVIIGLNLTPPPALLGVDKLAAADTVVQGDLLNFTIHYSANRATSLTVVDQLPTGMQLLHANPAPSAIAANGTITWSLGNVTAGAGAIQLSVKSFNAGLFTNQATVLDANSSVSGSQTVTVTRNAVLADFVTLAAVANEPNFNVVGGRGGRGTVALLGVKADGSTRLLSSFDTGQPAAEILVFTSDQQRLLVTDSSSRSLLVLNVSDPWAPILVANAPIPNGGEPSSVAVRPQSDYALVTVIDPANNLNNGVVYRFNLTSNSFEGAPLTLGANPDSIAIAPTGVAALVTNEADDDGAAGGPAGSVSLLTLDNTGVVAVTTTPVASFAGAGYADFSRVEPEFATTTPDGQYGLFTIQNPASDTALASVNLANGQIVDLQRFTILAGGGSNTQAEPDGVATYALNGAIYAATANEEDQSVSIWQVHGDGSLELLNSVRVEEFLPVPVDTNPASSGAEDNGLGNTTGNPVDDANFPYDDGEPDPEGIDATVIDGKAVVMVGLEESGAVLVLDVTNPASVTSLGLQRNLSADVREANTANSDRKSLTGRPEGVTIYKRPGALLTVTKVVVNDNGGALTVADFPLFVNGNTVASGQFNKLEPGSYTISESNAPGYAVAISGDCAANGTITLAIGDAKQCVITNDDIAPTVTLIKAVPNDPTVDLNSFGLSVDGAPVNSGQSVAVTAGAAVAINEVGRAGYEFVAISGDICPINLGDTVTLALDQHITCTITNQKQSFTGATLFLSTNRNGSVPGVPYRDEDILIYDPNTHTWDMLFDGSNVGLGGTDVDAFALLPNGHLLISTESDFNLRVYGAVDDADILEFIPTSLGFNTTVGHFATWFDGSDIGLNTTGEDIDSIDFDPAGNLLISVNGAFAALAQAAGDEDLIRFTGVVTGVNTLAGAAEIYFDGSAAGLTQNSEDILDTWISPAGDLYLSTLGEVTTASGFSASAGDLFICTPVSVGVPITDCNFSLFWDGTVHDLPNTSIDGLHIGDAPTFPTALFEASLDNTVEFAGDDADDAEESDEENTSQERVIHLPLVVR